MVDERLKTAVLLECQRVFDGWRALTVADFQFEPPKGFSTFTMVIRARVPAQPAGVLYRRLRGKENAILDQAAERAVFLALGAEQIAAHCYHYEDDFRLEELYSGRTLHAAELFDGPTLQKIAVQLHRFHHMPAPPLPDGSFFELLYEKWGAQARVVLEDSIDAFPPEERALCEPLREIYSEETRAMVRRCVAPGPRVFCHNDTYHGNIMRWETGEIRLLDFEFSCLNHPAFDFSNLFAETVMVHGLPAPPHFRIAEPRFGPREFGLLVDHYLDCETFQTAVGRAERRAQLVQSTGDMVMLSDYMYAMAALPLTLAPVQKIRFLPYASQRFARFRAAYARRFEG